MEKMFEYASRNKLRFVSSKGTLTVEDLWKLPLKSNNGIDLDSIAIDLDETMGKQTKSFVVEKSAETKESTDLKVSFEIVKYIIDVRLKEREEQEQVAERKAKKAKILELIANKQDEAIANKSVEELTKMLEDL